MCRKKIAEKLGYLTEDQVAELAGVQISTLDDWRRRGRGPEYVRFGTEYFYELEDISAHMRSIKKTRDGNKEALIRAI